MNIILVIFDSLRRDCVGAYGSPPWGMVQTPRFNDFAKESVMFTRAFPESLPTLPARRAIYTGQRVYPFHNADFRLKGDFVGAPGWGPIPEDQPTLAEMLAGAGYRTGLISDVYHMFKPSKNFSRGFKQWTFLRGQETDPYRSGPRLTQEEIDHWLPKEYQNEWTTEFVQQCIMNIRGRTREEDYFAPRVLSESMKWLEQNRDAEKIFLTVESFDPHEPWLVPVHYRKMYLKEEGQEHVISRYGEVGEEGKKYLPRLRANASGEVTMCDRWFGFFIQKLRELKMLDNTMVILTSDHGHSIGDRDFTGKRGYPSAPEVYEIPLLVRFPGASHAGFKSDMFIQHTDITASILDAAGVEPPGKIDGRPFLEDAVSGRRGTRDHATVAWGSSPTVITDKWWFNCKVNGKGILLHDLGAKDPFGKNIAAGNEETCRKLFALAKEDAGGSFPDWLVSLADREADAPGCSELVVRA